MCFMLFWYVRSEPFGYPLGGWGARRMVYCATRCDVNTDAYVGHLLRDRDTPRNQTRHARTRIYIYVHITRSAYPARLTCMMLILSSLSLSWVSTKRTVNMSVLHLHCIYCVPRCTNETQRQNNLFSIASKTHDPNPSRRLQNCSTESTAMTNIVYRLPQ